MDWDKRRREQMHNEDRDWELAHEDSKLSEPERLLNLLKDFELAIIDNGFIPKVVYGDNGMKHIYIRGERGEFAGEYKTVLISIRRDKKDNLLYELSKQYIEERKKLDKLL